MYVGNRFSPMLNTAKGTLMCRNFIPMFWRSRDAPENPLGNSPAVLAKHRRFHAYSIDANTTMNRRNI
jgi:hypothetical protein